MMQVAVISLACWARIGQGRRKQSIGQFQESETFEESHEPNPISLAELSHSSFSTAAAAWNPSLQPSIRHARLAVGNAPTIPSTAISETRKPHIGISTSVAGNGKHHIEDARLSSVVMKLPKTSLVDRTPSAMQSRAMDQVEEKQGWYGNSGRNVLILLFAKVCTRAALFFRNRRSHTSSPATSLGVTFRAPSISMLARPDPLAKKRFPIDISLIVCVAAWYLGNYYFNLTNKLALNATGGAAGFPLTIATLQLGIGAMYGIFLWLAPDARPKPTITLADYKATLPVAAAASAAHFGVVFSSGAASVSFAQIVFATEPVFAALIGTFLYGASISMAKLLSLIPIIGGVCLALYGEVQFSWVAFVAALFTNACAALRVNEHKKLMSTEGITDRLGSVGNQYAITTINMFLMSIPVALLAEGRKLGDFISMCSTLPVLIHNLIISGLAFYLYSEVATFVIKKAGPVTQSVLNCAKRAIIIAAVALVLGEDLGPLKLIGSGVSIAGVLLYSLVDDLVASRASKATQKSSK